MMRKKRSGEKWIVIDKNREKEELEEENDMKGVGKWARVITIESKEEWEEEREVS